MTKRVSLWREIALFYSENSGAGKTLQSWGTESVLDAVILANNDARTGKLSAEPRTAFAHLWQLQENKGIQRGAWPWLDFGTERFQARDSTFHGASLAALAVGLAPENYQTDPAITISSASVRLSPP